MHKIEKISTLILIALLVIIAMFLVFCLFLPCDLLKSRSAGILGLEMSFFGAVLLGITLVKPDKEIREMANNVTYDGHLPLLEKDMFQNRKMALAGLILMSLGFIFQLLDIIFSYNT